MRLCDPLQSPQSYLYVVLMLTVLGGGPAGARAQAQPEVEYFHADGPSMLPTIHAGQHVVVDRASYRTSAPKRGDVVLAHAPDGLMVFKRVYAVPGDTIEQRADGLWLNGKNLSRHVGKGCGTRTDDDASCVEEVLAGTKIRFWQRPPKPWGPIKVEADSFFLLGDNRSRSNDSRVFGPLPGGALLGRVVEVCSCVPEDPGFNETPPAPPLQRFGQTSAWMKRAGWTEAVEDGQPMWSHETGAVLVVQERDKGGGHFKAITTAFRAAGKTVIADSERKFGPWCGSLHEIRQQIDGQELHTIMATIEAHGRVVAVVGHAPATAKGAIQHVRKAVESLRIHRLR